MRYLLFDSETLLLKGFLEAVLEEGEEPSAEGLLVAIDEFPVLPEGETLRITASGAYERVAATPATLEPAHGPH